ncbi:Rrf2 family transcriptional regulator [Pedobacter sp. HMF7647]|uniref:Rrf2 family transcriptional regulator n=1 Tax=Hufsiella arboris TaxID=2695275 RepID=A0A7K1YB02_9SPHI|nr:Rrf2 family transcriptional regulator [Hufsiella arboris]
MLTKKAKYAFKALIALARNEEKHPMLISDIAEKEQLPKKFLEAILLELKRSGYLGSKKGAGGGYYLLKQASEIKMSSIIRVIDGPIALLPCVSLNFYERCEECTETYCGIRDVMKDVRDATLKILGETSIADMVARENTLAPRLQNQDVPTVSTNNQPLESNGKSDIVDL